MAIQSSLVCVALALLFLVIAPPEACGHFCYQPNQDDPSSPSTKQNTTTATNSSASPSLLSCFMQLPSDVWLQSSVRRVEFRVASRTFQKPFSSYGKLITPLPGWSGRLDSVLLSDAQPRATPLCLPSNFLGGRPLAYTFTGPTVIDALQLNFSSSKPLCQLALDGNVLRYSRVKSLDVTYGGRLQLSSGFIDSAMGTLRRLSVSAAYLDWPFDESLWVTLCRAKYLDLTIQAKEVSPRTALALVRLSRQCSRIDLTVVQWPVVDCNCEFLRAWPAAVGDTFEFSHDVKCSQASSPANNVTLRLSEVKYPVRCYVAASAAVDAPTRQPNVLVPFGGRRPTAANLWSKPTQMAAEISRKDDVAAVASADDESHANVGTTSNRRVFLHHGNSYSISATFLLAAAVLLFVFVQILQLRRNRRENNRSAATSGVVVVTEKAPR